MAIVALGHFPLRLGLRLVILLAVVAVVLYQGYRGRRRR